MARFGPKSVRFPCENANLPHCTYFTHIRGSRTPQSAHHPHKSHDEHRQCNPGGGIHFAVLLGSDNSYTTPFEIPFLIRSPLWWRYMVGGPLGRVLRRDIRRGSTRLFESTTPLRRAPETAAAVSLTINPHRRLRGPNWGLFLSWNSCVHGGLLQRFPKSVVTVKYYSSRKKRPLIAVNGR